MGIRVLDTAAAYGDSEANLGACGMQRWSVITKVSSLRDWDDAKLGAVARESVLRSLDKLGSEKLHAVLAHDCHDAVGDSGRRFHDAIAPLVESGLIDKIGVSVYEPDDWDGIDSKNLQIVQAPLNVLDQRLLRSGVASRLSAVGGELHARSVFLQGLLLLPAAARPASFAPWLEKLSRYDSHVKSSGLDPAAVCLGFVASQSAVRRCVIGVDTVDQLTQVVKGFQACNGKLSDNLEMLGSDDAGLIDPRQWLSTA